MRRSGGSALFPNSLLRLFLRSRLKKKDNIMSQYPDHYLQEVWVSLSVKAEVYDLPSQV